jgi:hypothetical protein
MLFNSLTFLVFLPAVFALYWALPRRGQNAFLVVASYVFYGWWDWRFLGLIVLSSLVDYLAGPGIARGRAPRRWLAALAGPWPGGPLWNPWFLAAAATVAPEWAQRRRPHGLALPGAGNATRLALFALTALLVVLLGRVEVVPFIYFQF